MLVAGGSTSVITYFALRLTADGKAATGLTITGFDLQYVRSGVAPVAKVNATALAATDSAWDDNKAIEIDSTDQPGLYRVDWPDAAFAAGVREVILTVKVATAFTEHLRVEIDGEVTAEALGTQAKADVNTEVDNSMVTYGLDHLISASVADTDVADNSIIAEMVDAGSTSDYTNYSKTEDSLRAISEKVSSIGSASGGGFNFAAVGADALTDTINNAEAAVDKSTSPATVGIPVTSHAFLKGHEVTIAGTANYNGSFVIDSVTTNEVVIVSSFTAETFSGSDTIVSSIKATSIEGVQTTNTFASTVSEDGVYHVIDDDGSNNFTISYRFEVGGGRIATEAVFHGFLNSNNDNAFLQAYDFVGSAWETRALLTGQNGSANQAITISLLARNTGTSAVDLGVVFLRITDDTPRGSSNPTLNVDSLLVEAVGIGQTVGYEMGTVWIDTDDGVSGTESFVNGVADNPCLTLANAITIAANVKLHRFICTPDSSITFGETHNNEVWEGEGADMALGTRDVGGCHFMGMDVSGTGTGSIEIHFDHCELGTMTIARMHADTCDIEGTVTLSGAATYNFVDCSHSGGTPTIDFGSTVGNTTVHVHNYHGALTIKNMGQNGTDVLHFSSSNGKLTLDNTNTGGTVNLNGTFDLVNSGTGQTLNRDGDAMQTISKFVFTNSNEVDANTKSINDAEVVGDGNATPWDGV